jgi:GNAT superfamily N-acetyltransferase
VPCDRTPFAIRMARACDKDAVLAFCEHTFYWGDYLPLVWDEWLSEEKGQLLVATLDDVPVGVARVVLLTPTEAWLEGLRVHPQYRRHGLAAQFLKHCLDVARQRGAQVARLATTSTNAAVHKTTERAGMHRVAAAWPLEAEALAADETAPCLSRLTVRDWPWTSERITNGVLLAEMGGLYGAGWAWQQLTAAKLRFHLERGQVLALRDSNGAINAAAIIADADEDWKALPVAYVDGTNRHAEILARGLRQYAASLCLEKVEVAIPAASPLCQTFANAGYQPEMEAEAEIWIYELDLKGAPS